MIDHSIRLAQLAYAARPFAVRWVDSHSSLTCRFDTFEEAFAYLQDQFARQSKEVRQYKFRATNLWASNIQFPDGTSVQARYFLLTNDVSSY